MAASVAIFYFRHFENDRCGFWVIWRVDCALL